MLKKSTAKKTAAVKKTDFIILPFIHLEQCLYIISEKKPLFYLEFNCTIANKDCYGQAILQTLAPSSPLCVRNL